MGSFFGPNIGNLQTLKTILQFSYNAETETVIDFFIYMIGLSQAKTGREQRD